MSKRISYQEYKRRVFNTALVECLNTVEVQAINGCCDLDTKSDQYKEMCKKMTDSFYTDLIGLDKNTITDTKNKLAEAVTFVKDCINISEAIAEDKMQMAADEKIEVTDETKPELSDEDKYLIDKLFDEKNPEVQVDAIRNASVNALLAEDKKAQEIKDSIDLAKLRVSSGEDPKVIEETVKSIGSRGPTSLMNAILNSISTMAIKDINENSEEIKSVSTIMSEAADDIKSRAVMLYSLYEASSILGIHKWTPDEVRREASRIYYNK